MQYEPGLSRDELIQLATETYFGNVDAKNMEAQLDEVLVAARKAKQLDHMKDNMK